MNRESEKWIRTGIIFVALTLAGSAFATRGAAQQPAPTPAPAPAGKDKPASAPLTLDAAPAPPPVNAEEDAAMKAFRDAPPADFRKKNELGEAFVQKYPESRYRSEVYNWLVKGYLASEDEKKMEAAGEKELELTPNDAQTLAILGSTIPRTINPATQDPAKRLEKAEQYSKKALDLVPTFQKPEGISNEIFVAAKNQTMALAYTGLGLVAFRRGKHAEAVTNLEQAVKLEQTPDPVNYYILGVSNERTSHFEDAVAAFTKCAGIPGSLQASCKSGIDEAKKLATTQLSAPK